MSENLERVTGIGGIFFRARDLEATSAWYEKHLGLRLKDSAAEFAWREHDQNVKTVEALKR
jgi:catechol 2,3-dioxygenase-like lactoylglutathione lyase family enzyme